jgi:hypothetical protein
MTNDQDPWLMLNLLPCWSLLTLCDVLD